MKVNVHRRLKTLIEDTNTAFIESGGSLNADYASFASMALSDFKNVLANQELTAQELRQILRKASTSHREYAPKGCWATFMATYMTRNANSNTQDMFH